MVERTVGSYLEPFVPWYKSRVLVIVSAGPIE